MAARFTAGTNMKSTADLSQKARVPISRGTGRSKAGGLPGYIKTTQDKSSSGLASAKDRRGAAQSGPRREGSIPSRKGESRRDWQAASSTGGSQDESYHNTSTARAGSIRVLGEPKAPAKRGTYGVETGHGGTTGSRSAVKMGGVTGANKMPPQGISADRTGPNHTPGAGHRGLGSRPASGQKAADRGGWKTTGRESSIGNKAPPTAKGFIGGGSPKGTMESLRGRVSTDKNFGMGGKRAKSMMY